MQEKGLENLKTEFEKLMKTMFVKGEIKGNEQPFYIEDLFFSEQIYHIINKFT